MESSLPSPLVDKEISFFSETKGQTQVRLDLVSNFVFRLECYPLKHFVIRDF